MLILFMIRLESYLCFLFVFGTGNNKIKFKTEKY